LRLLLALLGAQAVAIAAADACWLPAAVAARVALVAAGVALLARAPAPRRAAACAALAAASAFGLAARLEQAGAAPAAPFAATIEATVTAVRPLPGAVQVELASVRAVEPTAAPVPPRLHASTADATALAEAVPGHRLRAAVRIRPREGRANPGGVDRARAAARRGIGATASLAHPDLLVRRPDAERWQPQAPLHRLRARAAERLAREGEGGALLAALGVGQRSGLGDASREAFRRLGVSHLLSVSGLHLALAGALAFGAAAFALARAGPARVRVDPRGPALGAACAAAASYALLAGFGVPVRRALVLLIGMALAIAARRPAPRGAPLIAAALLVLAFDPASLFDVGARLSFAASAALVWAVRASEGQPTEGGWRARARRGLSGSLAATAVAGAATAPLAAATLGVAAPAWALAANALAIPWTGALLLPASLLASLAAGLAPDAPATGWICAGSAQLASLTLRALAAAAARAPLAPAAPVTWPALAVAVAFAALAVRAHRVGLRVAAVLAVGAVLRLAPPPAIAPAPPRLVVLDVGQGDAVLVQGRTGAMLVDGGVALPDGLDLGATVVVPALRALGVERLDLLVASHADLDHRGGLPAVLRALPVARVWLPYGGLGDPSFAGVIAAARSAGAALEEQGAGGAPLRAGELRVVPLWPPPGPVGSARNERSLTLRVEVGARTVLLPGDLEAGAEARLLARGAPLRADVLTLGHHGSRTSSIAAWLAAVDAVVAVASAPRAGRFGMPHAEVVERACAAGTALWWTGRDGAVLIGLEPALPVRGWRHALDATASRTCSGAGRPAVRSSHRR
jgi:competence protein ComEC